MQWIQLLLLYFSNAILIVCLNLLSRKDRLQMGIKTDTYMKELLQMKKEFDARHCAIREINRRNQGK